MNTSLPTSVNDHLNGRRFDIYTVLNDNDTFDQPLGGGLDDDSKLKIMQSDIEDGRFNMTAEIIILLQFIVMISFGAIGNGLVCYVVVKNPHMRTPRNIFIINLAISDLTLCLFTQPLNLYRLLNTQWNLGSFMCRFSAMLQGTNVFVSTISITAIALDRFQVIVYPTKNSMKTIGGAVALLTIWIISLLMSSPLIIFSLYKESKPLPEIEFYFKHCIEDTRLRAEKGAYSVASMVVQYILPVITVSIAHARICNKLKYRMVNRRPPRSSADITTQNAAANRNSSAECGRSVRKRKTNILLAFIAIVFVLSWLPLNISNILTEFQFQLFSTHAIDINLVYVVCHTLVLSSACTNPVLYGWLNDNFRKEFVKILYCASCNICKRELVSCCRRASGNTIPLITLTPYVNGGNAHGCGERRPKNISKMTTTDIDHTCAHAAVSV